MPPPETSAEQSWVSRHEADIFFVCFCTSMMEELFGGKFSDMLQPV